MNSAGQPLPAIGRAQAQGAGATAVSPAERKKVRQATIELEAIFLKEMLKSGSLDNRSRKHVERNLEQAYSNNLWSGNSLLREQASYYLACLESLHGIQFLEDIYWKEPDKFVQRGI